MQQIRQRAYAKINIGLDVLRRRPDGYHEVMLLLISGPCILNKLIVFIKERIGGV